MWFMQGKEGKQYKANSLYQFMRRLGFFPTEVCGRPCVRRSVRFADGAVAEPEGLHASCVCAMVAGNKARKPRTGF